MGKQRKKNIIPEHKQATEFLRGQSSKIFKEVASKDDVVVVNKSSRPYVVIISYDRYVRLKKEEDADI